jgi:hypothetical protein
MAIAPLPSSLLRGLLAIAVTALAALAAAFLFATFLPSTTDTQTDAAAALRHTSLEIAWLRLRAVTDRSNPPAP